MAGILLSSLVMLAQCTGAPGVSGGEPAPLVDPGVRAATSVGASRVIVGLRITPPFTPEGDLPTAASVATQRQSIARTQAAVLARLAGTRFSVLHQYEGLPFVALEIGADALARLDAAGDLVTTIVPDRTPTTQ